MLEPNKLEKKQERKNNFPQEHLAALGLGLYLVRYLPCIVSLWIFASFISNSNWLGAAITFPVILMMLAWAAYCRRFSLQIQKQMNSGKRARLNRQAPKPNFHLANPDIETANLSGADLSDADLSAIDLTGADLRYANLRGANLRYANLRYADLSGADLSGVELQYADLSGAELKNANLTKANLRYANLSNANLNCTLLHGANFSDANLSGTLLFFLNLREVLNLEPFQLKAKPAPFLCNVALPHYAQRLNISPNHARAQIAQLLGDRYRLSLEEAQWIVDEVRQHQWD